MRIGVISDTHGYLDPRVTAAFAGAGLILHAGDVGSIDVLARLEELAPVVAVRGNNDDKLGGLGLPLRQDVEAEGLHIHLVHKLSQASPPPGAAVVVYGHSHVPLAQERDGTLFLNPGAAGRVGFHRLQTVALLEVAGGRVDWRLIEIGARAPRRTAKGRASSALPGQ